MDFLDDGAILCPRIECIEQVNDVMLSFINNEEITYLSSKTPY